MNAHAFAYTRINIFKPKSSIAQLTPLLKTFKIFNCCNFQECSSKYQISTHCAYYLWNKGLETPI